MLRKYRKKTRSLGETEKGMWKRVTVTAVTTLTARGVFSDTQTGNVEKGDSHCSDYSHSQRGIFRHANSYKIK